MKKNNKLNICIIGAGRTGTTFAYVLAGNKSGDLKIVSVSSRSDASIKRAKEILGGLAKDINFTKNNIEAAAAANCVMICTPDDKIKDAAEEVFKSGSIDPTKYTVIHSSGSRSLKALEAAGSAGAGIASVHPLKSFASIPEAIETIPGTFFGLTSGGGEARKAAARIVEGLHGIVIEVEDSKKPLYHAAACVASNYMVTLINYAVFLHEVAGIKPDDSLKGLMSLIEGTIENIKKMGTKKSLTGPVARGDTGTIEEHIKNLENNLNQEDISLYRLMGIETAKIAKHNKWIDDKAVRRLENILKNRS